MTKTQLAQKVLQYDWEYWAARPYGAFALSLFRDGQTRNYMRRFGVDAELPAMLFQRGAWYKSQEVWDEFAGQLERYLKKGGTVARVVRSCEEFHSRERNHVLKLAESKQDPVQLLAELYEILTQGISFLWFTHGFEHIYIARLRREIPKYYTGDTEKFLGDASFPVKKNAHVYFEQALRSQQPLEHIQKQYGWIKVRDGFSAGFSLRELAAARKRLQSSKREYYSHPAVPRALQQLVAVARDLVYFRTLRTDVLHELLYLARPLLRRVARHYGISFSQVRDHSVEDLMIGRLQKYPIDKVCAVWWRGQFALFNHPILNDVYGGERELRGVVACAGQAVGKAKVVMNAHQVGKVMLGDILIAPTTAPSYLVGMKRAAAFVTDEGGMTSHAAIVARESNKPCVIGTKIATKIIRNGDLIEVDASRGVVRKVAKY